MQQHIIEGLIRLPEKQAEKQLHRKLGEFARWMKLPKDASQIQKDKSQSVPTALLPMVF